MDLGGTWLRAVAVDGSGREVARARRPAPAPSQWAPALRQILRRWKLRPRVLVIGAKGAGDAKTRATMRRSLLRSARRVIVLTDIETAWLAALGGRPGILILAGTGSCAYGRDARGRSARAGGLGPLLGDEGSAFWIGKEWTKTLPERQVLKLAHHPRVVRATAALAKTVLARQDRDPAARRIVQAAHRALASQAEAAASHLRFQGPVPISWHGGLFRNPVFLKGFLRLLRRSRRRWAPAPPQALPEQAAARSWRTRTTSPKWVRVAAVGRIARPSLGGRWAPPPTGPAP